MEDSSRLVLIAVGILAVGLLVGYTIGRSGVRKARKSGLSRVVEAEKEAEAAREALTTCTAKQAVRPPTPSQLVAPQRTEAVLRLTQAELALRSENAGTARSRLVDAAARLRQLAKRVPAAAAHRLRSVAGQLEGIRVAILRLDPRNRPAVAQVAAQLRELRRSVTYLPLGKQTN